MIRQFVLNTLLPIPFFRSLFLLCFVIFCDLCQAGYEMFYKLFFSCFTMVTHFVVLVRGEKEGAGRQVSWSVWPSINYYGLMIL